MSDAIGESIVMLLGGIISTFKLVEAVRDQSYNERVAWPQDE